METGINTALMTPFDLFSVVQSLDEFSWKEVRAISYIDTQEQLLSHVLSLGGFKFSVKNNAGVPVIVFGFNPASHGVFSTWWLTSRNVERDDWIAASKAAKRVVEKILSSGTAHRLETLCIEGNKGMNGWFERFGFHRESMLKNKGRNREDFYLYVRLKEE